MSWLILIAPLHAFAPADDVWIGIEPRRVYATHASVQTRLRRSPDWIAFTAGEGAGWQARFDERTGQIRRASGPGIAMGTLSSQKAVEGAVRRVLDRHPGLVGVAADQLALKTATHVAATDTWYVQFDRLVDGVPVWRGGVTARIVRGELVMLGLDTYPELEGVGDVAISEADALARAQSLGPAAFAQHTDASAKLVVLPVDAQGQLTFRLCWETRTRTSSPPGLWVSFVDAATGELVSVHNEVRFLAGSIAGRHDTRTVDGDMSVSTLPLVSFIGSAGSSASALADGSFTLGDTETWTTRLRGEWLTVRNSSGSNGEMSVADAAPVWSDAEATQAEIDTYVFLHQVREWAKLYAPDVVAVETTLRSNVNLDSTCNAYWDGSVNFYEQGGGCNNTGRIADVTYHEWGHGFHYYSIVSGVYDGTMSEGIGDVTAVLQTLDPDLAPYFYTSGSPIRELGPDRVYPEDVYNEVHEDGLIYGGAMWDLYSALLETYGEDGTTKGEAWAVTSTLLAGSIRGGPELDTIYDEMVLADDVYGGAHLCEIVDAFGQHGLGPVGDVALLTMDHEGIGNQAAGVAPGVAGEIVNLTPQCTSFTLGTVDAVYSVDGGESWETVPLDVAGEGFEGSLPAFEEGTVVSYYLVADGADGTEVMAPAGGDIAPYTFYVGELEEVYCADFEEDDADFEHALVDGDSNPGADDWAWGAPHGVAGDPEDAYSGANVWGNDLGVGEYNGEYQPDIVNRLSSPSIALGEPGTYLLQFRRWLNVEDAEYDLATVYADDEAVWTNHQSRAGDEHTQDGDWMLHTSLFDATEDFVVLGWEIDSDGGLELGGWNIDDVCVYRIVEPGGDTGDPGDDTGSPDDSGDPSLPDGTGTVDDDPIELKSQCGCNGAAAPASAAGLALAALSLARRRRRG